MHRVQTLALCVAVTFVVAACGSDSSVPTGASSTASVSTWTLSGTITATTGGAVSGATVTIADGPNAGRAGTTSANGFYSISNLAQSGFTINISAPNYISTSLPVTLTSNQTVNTILAPAFAKMLGAWSGFFTTSGLGASVSCNMTWVITSQTAGNFSGTFQVSGATGCSQAGVIGGIITTSNAVTALDGFSTVTNGAVCRDSGASQNGVLSGRTLTVQSTFTRSCTSPVVISFQASQTISMTRQ